MDPIQDVSVNIGAKTVAFSEGVRTVRTGSAEILRAIRETAAGSREAVRVQEEGARRVQAAREREIEVVRRAEAAATKAAEAEIAAARRREAAVSAEAALIARKEAEIAAARSATGRKATDAAATIERAKARIAAAYEAEATAKARSTQRIVDLEAVRATAAQRANAAVEREAARHAAVVDRVTARIAQAQGVAGGTAPGGGRRAGQIQNAAYQIGDVFTQVAAGTDPARAIAIQLPQLLGGFGVAGAVAGAAAAAIAPFVMQLVDGADAAEAAADRAAALADTVDALTGAVARSTSANAAARRSMADLVAEYGNAAGAIAALDKRQAAVAARQAQLQVDATGAAVAGQFGDGGRMTALLDTLAAANLPLATARAGELAVALDQLGEGADLELGGALGQLQEITESLGIGEEAARGLYERILAVQSASGPAEQADAYRQMSEYVVQTAGGTDQLTAAQAELVSRLDEAARQAAILAANAGDVSLDPAVASAQRLTAELGRAQGQMASLLQSQAAQLRAAQLRLQHAGDPVGLAGAAARDQAAASIGGLSGKERDDLVAFPGVAEARARAAAEAEAAAAAAEAVVRESQRQPAAAGSGTRSAGVSRSGGAGASVSRGAAAEQRAYNDLLREAGSLYDATRTDAERYASELASIQRLEAAGVLGLTEDQRAQITGMNEVERAALLAETAGQNAEVAQRAIAGLRDEYGGLGEVGETIREGAGAAFGAIVTGAGSAKEAVQQLAQRMATMFADRAFDSLWSTLSGAVSGGGGGGIGSFLTSLIPGFAGGTDWAPAGLALVGERGPELVHFASAGSQVIPADRTRQLLASGGGPMRIVIDTTPDFHARIERSQAEVAVTTTRRGLAEYSRSVAPTRQAQIAANPRRRG